MKGSLGTKERLLTILALLLVNWVSPSLGQTREVKGAHAAVRYSDGKATFTISNDSTHDIRCWVIQIVSSYADGHRDVSGHMENYGPFASDTIPRSQGLLAGKSIEFTQQVGQPKPLSVTAKVTVVIFDDNTAESIDDAELNQIITDRKNSAYTVQRIRDILNDAVLDDRPKLKARQNLQTLLTSTDARVNKALVQGEISNLDNVDMSRERESIRDHANGFDHLAKTHAGYENVRRLP